MMQDSHTVAHFGSFRTQFAVQEGCSRGAPSRGTFHIVLMNNPLEPLR
jgi:hypothetical protein